MGSYSRGCLVEINVVKVVLEGGVVVRLGWRREMMLAGLEKC